MISKKKNPKQTRVSQYFWRIKSWEAETRRSWVRKLRFRSQSILGGEQQVIIMHLREGAKCQVVLSFWRYVQFSVSFILSTFGGTETCWEQVQKWNFSFSEFFIFKENNTETGQWAKLGACTYCQNMTFLEWNIHFKVPKYLLNIRAGHPNIFGISRWMWIKYLSFPWLFTTD